MNIFIANYKIKSFFTKTNQFLSFIHPKAPKLKIFILIFMTTQRPVKSDM